VNEPAVSEATTEVTPEQEAQEAADALSAGYKKARGEAPAQVEHPAAQEEKEVTQEAAPEANKGAPSLDPWDGVNPALKEMLQGISTKVNEVDQLGQRFRSFEGRLGAVQNAIAAANAAAKASGTTAPTEKQLTDAMQSTGKWDALMADMTDWKEAFEERLAAHAATLSRAAPSVDVDGIKKDLATGFTKSVQEIAEASTQKARQLAQLDIKYPTWEADIKTQEFDGWIKAQAPEIRALTESERATDAMKVLDAFAEHRKAVEKQEKNRARLAAVVAPKQATSGGPAVLPDEAGLSVGYNRVRGRRT